MKALPTLALAAVVLAGAASGAQAQGAEQKAAPVAPKSGYRAEFLGELDTRAQKYMQLAEAIPAEKYTWRPGQGVRSVSEAILHVAAANYNLSRRLGSAPPAGFNLQGYETSTTDKAQVVAALKSSFDHMRAAAIAAEDNPEGTQQWFGGQTITNRGILLFLTGHYGEHLGQLIAYARVNGVKPPWSGE